MTTPEVTVTSTTYTVSLLPSTNELHRRYAIHVELRFGNLWAVVRAWDGFWLNGDDGWDPAYQSGRQDAEWLSEGRHLFQFADAISRAAAAAPHVEFRGVTAAQAFAATEGTR